MSDNTTPHSASAYDDEVRSIIPFYDLFHGETIDLIRTIHPDAGEWLDTGCGTGELIHKASSFFPTTHFTLADPSAKMIEEAQKKLKDLPDSRKTFIPMQGTQDLRLKPETFDVITAIQSHHYLRRDERLSALRKCLSLLKKEGLLVYFEHITPDTMHGEAVGMKRWQAFFRGKKQPETIILEQAKRRYTSYFPEPREVHLSMLRQLGFKVVELFWLSHMQAGFYALK